MAARRKVILAALGSAGAVYPFVGLGEELQRRGHEVVLITAAYHAPVAKASGLECIELGTVEDARRLMAEADPRDPRSQVMANRAILYCGLGPLYEQVIAQIIPGKTVVVHSQACLGARIAYETTRVPLVSLVTQPFSLRSAEEALVYHPRVQWLVRLGRPARRFFLAMLNRFFFDRHVTPVVNAFRAAVGLAAVSWRENPRWLFSPQRIVGAWPEWYGPRQRDWPEQVVLTGFILHDRGEGRVASGAMPLDGQPAPVVFTPGSWVTRGEHLFAAVADACQQLECPGVLVTRHAAQLPKPLPPGVRHVSYAPFSELFPRAAVVVHHAGVGTTAQGLRAGRPQVCVPLGGDQFDNTARVARLGVGAGITQARFTGERLAQVVRKLLASEPVKARCRYWRERVDSQAGVKAASDCVEALAESQLK